MTFIERLLPWIIRLIFRINGRLEVKGIDNIPMEGGVIVASNHISYLDPPLLGAIIPRKVTFMARRGLFDIKVPLLRWVIRHYAFPVDREKTLPSTIKEALRRLKNRELLVIFPEGRRSETGGLLEGKKGIGLIVGRSRVAVVPALIQGTDRALPVGGKWLRKAKISVIFDKPLYFSENNSELITKKIMTLIGELKKDHADNSS